MTSQQTTPQTSQTKTYESFTFISSPIIDIAKPKLEHLEARKKDLETTTANLTAMFNNIQLTHDDSESEPEIATLSDIGKFLKKMNRRINNNFKKINNKLDIMSKNVDVKFEILATDVSKTQEILKASNIQLIIERAKQHNRINPLSMLPVPNTDGDTPESKGLKPITSIVDFVDFSTKGTALNSYLEFYKFKEGVDFNAKGPILQRKSLLAKTLGISLDYLSNN